MVCDDLLVVLGLVHWRADAGDREPRTGQHLVHDGVRPWFVGGGTEFVGFNWRALIALNAYKPNQTIRYVR